MKRFQHVIILLVLLAAFAIYSHDLDVASLWRDEALSILRSDQPLALLLQGRNVVQGVVSADLHPPLYFLALKVWRVLVGTSVFANRYLTVLTMLLGGAIIARVTREIAGKQANVPILLLITSSPFCYWYARETRMYALVVLTGGIFLLTWWRLLHRDTLRHYFQFALATLLLFATHYMNIFLIVAAIGVLLLSRFSLRLVFVLLGIALLGFFTLQDSILTVLGGEYLFFAARPLSVLIREPLSTFWLGTTDPPTLDFYWYLPFIALIIIGFLSPFRWQKGELYWLWFGLGGVSFTILLVYLGGFVRANYSNPRHITALLPLVLVVTGRGMVEIGRKSPTLQLLAIAMLTIPLYPAWQQTLTDPPQPHDNIAGLQNYLEKRVRPGDLILWHEPDVSVTWDLYELPNIRQTTLLRIHQSPADGVAELQSLLETTDRIWFVESRFDQTSITDIVSTWEQVDDWWFDGSWIFPRVTLYRHPERFVSGATIQTFDGGQFESTLVAGGGIWVDVPTVDTGKMMCVGLLDSNDIIHTQTCQTVEQKIYTHQMLWLPLPAGLPPISYQLFLQTDSREILDTVQITPSPPQANTTVDWVAEQFTAGQWAVGAIVWTVDDSSEQASFVMRLVDRWGRPLGDGVSVDSVSADYPPTAWQSGDTLRANFAVPLPFSVNGTYWLQLQPLDAANNALSNWQTLGRTQIEPVPYVDTLPETISALSNPVAFGEAIMLEAAEIEPLEGRINIDLFWRANEVISADYHTFIHITQPNEPPIAQAGGVPVENSRPTTSWRRGELLTDRYTIFLPEGFDPTGYQVAVGLYNSADTIRLSVNGNSDGIYFLQELP